jgi:carboxyl-terminal processing protease
LKKTTLGWLALGLLLTVGLAQQEAYSLRFEQAWRLVHERYWDSNHHGVDWSAVGERYRARLARITGWDELYALISAMYDEIGDQHTSFLSPEEARYYLAGAQCYPLPFKEEGPVALAPSSPRVLNAPPPATAPAQPDRPRTGPGEPAFPPSRVEYRERIVVFRLSNLVDGSGPRMLRQAIEQHDAQAIGYVLDLRGNPGGLAIRMAEVAGFFMRGVPWRLVTRGLGVAPLPTTPPFGRPLTQKPLVVLIDGEVNSAAEGLAGALKNARRAYLIGTRTAGNTEIVLPYCFPDGAVALVASGVLAPLSGPTWEGRGVEPDRVVEKDPLAAAMEYLKRLR